MGGQSSGPAPAAGQPGQSQGGIFGQAQGAAGPAQVPQSPIPQTASGLFGPKPPSYQPYQSTLPMKPGYQPVPQNPWSRVFPSNGLPYGKPPPPPGWGGQMPVPTQTQPPPQLGGGMAGIEPRGLGGVPQSTFGGPGFTGGEPALPPPGAPSAPPAPQMVPRNRMDSMVRSLRRTPLGGDF